MKKVVLLTRNFPDHFELISTLIETNLLSGIVMITENLPVKTGKLFDEYYILRKQSRTKFFGNRYDNITNIKTLTISKSDEINSDNVKDFIKDINPDLTLIYDIPNIENHLLESIPGEKWKIHEGYVQKYKGLNGNIHACIDNHGELITHSIIEYNNVSDNGRIIHQSDTKFRNEDTITDRSYRSFRKLIYDIVPIMEKFNNDTIKYFENNDSIVYANNDFTEEILETLLKKEFLALNFDNKNIEENKFLNQI